MLTYTLSEIARITGGCLLPGSAGGLRVRGVVTDTRKMIPGALFVALRGEHFDAHDFVSQAMAQGAAAVLAERPSDAPGVLAGNSLEAFQRLAAHWRQQFRIPVLAVTGSCGKTTVKEILAAILRESGEVLATRGNLNNHIGVPLTLSQMGKEHRHAVIEMGMNHAGELTLLSRMAAPGIAIINNAAAAHLEGLGSIAAVAAAKGEILVGLQERGIAVLNGDDSYADYWKGQASGEVWLFSMEDRPVRVRGSWQPAETGGRMEIRAPQGQFSVDIPLPGKHNGANVLAAATAALALDIPPAHISRAIAHLDGVPGRLRWRPGRLGTRILDDSYNANPASLEAAIQVLAQQPGQRYLVLGDMGELGPDAALYHHQAGMRLKQLGIEGLFTLGDLSRAAAESFGTGAHAFSGLEDLLRAMEPVLGRQTTILVKGSRAAHMERVASALVEEG